MAFATPSDEDGLGGAEFGDQARAGPATGAQFNEALDGFFVVHSVLSRRLDVSREPALFVRRPAANDSQLTISTRGAHAHRITTLSRRERPKTSLEAAAHSICKRRLQITVSAAHGQRVFCRPPRHRAAMGLARDRLRWVGEGVKCNFTFIYIVPTER